MRCVLATMCLLIVCSVSADAFADAKAAGTSLKPIVIGYIPARLSHVVPEPAPEPAEQKSEPTQSIEYKAPPQEPRLTEEEERSRRLKIGLGIGIPLLAAGVAMGAAVAIVAARFEL